MLNGIPTLIAVDGPIATLHRIPTVSSSQTAGGFPTQVRFFYIERAALVITSESDDCSSPGAETLAAAEVERPKAVSAEGETVSGASEIEQRTKFSIGQAVPVSENSLPLTAEHVVFTGILASMTHREAFRLVEQYGGRATQSVSSATTMLVIGEEGWPLEADGATSQKLRQAMQVLADGGHMRIVAESDWLHLLGLNERREEIQKAYTPAMLSRLLEIPVRLIRRWARLGLIRPVRRVCRLPYFDYREVASARRLAALLDQGVSPETIERSLSELSQTLAGTDRSLAQLNILVQDENVLLRDAHGVIQPRTGQRLLDFDGVAQLSVAAGDDVLPEAKGVGETTDSEMASESDEGPVSFSITEARLQLGDRRMKDWNADEWFHEGCRLAEETEFESAVNAFRNSMSLLVSEQSLLRVDLDSDPLERAVFPDPAEVNFHLADALYRVGRPDAAIERYHCAIEFAPDFIEAWTQLGCLQTEAGQYESAEESFVTAISIHRGNPDALLHYAQLLEQMDRFEEAGTYWQQYLEHDSRGPWAEHARQRLEQIQLGAAATRTPLSNVDGK